MNRLKHSKFLIEQKSHNITRYHDSLIAGVKALMAGMGKKSKEDLM